MSPRRRTTVQAHLHHGDGGTPAEPGGPFWAAADRARRSPAWRYREVATGHMIASNRPGDLARLLLELARRRRTLPHGPVRGRPG